MEEICVLIAERKRKGLKRYIYTRKSITELDVVLDIYTVFCPKSVFTARRLKKICSKYKYVYSKDIIFSKYCKKKEESLLNFLPCLSVTKIANANRINLAEENIGIVIKSKKFVNINFLTKLCKNIKYIRIYGSDRDTDNIIMEATGICVQPGKDKTEKIIIYLDDNIYFKVSDKIITDLKITVPEYLKPFDDIVCHALKCENPDKIMKKTGVVVREFVYTWQNGVNSV